ncbi:MAG: 2-polyprenylphenol 6-hydroxylase, partial [Alphaproteobacteria bacterium]|nr:2-polyprenylphenol 6-hydroxylase [Alphaproteobacteria bacterium]
LLGQLFQITKAFQMETQPELLLLQKTMLVAEGTARKLSPDANMWMLARPLIKEWMEQTLGPEARVRDAFEGIASTVNKLPSVMERLEESANMISGGRVRLHPETIKQLRRDSWSDGVARSLWFAAIFLLLVVIIARLN